MRLRKKLFWGFIMKRIVTIQDISCIGKCSLTVALPIISAMGVETAILPTAVLSTHTMFRNFTCKDLTDQFLPIEEHWAKENFHFDAIYTGYLGSFEQISLVSGFFDRFRSEDTVVVVDPVMADNGKLYPAFDEAYAKENTKLCSKADIILPNLTEASFMTGLPYKTEYDRAYIMEMLRALAALGPKYAVLTGVSFTPGKVFPHNLRHLFARVFYSIHKDLAKLADILGHSNINTTRIYIVSSGIEHRRYLESMRLII